jgi:hypothetical protein
MRRSKKFSVSDLPEITADKEVIEEKTIHHEGHDYTYVIEKYTMYENYNSIVVTGGPYNYRATTTCKKQVIKKTLKTLINKLKHK